MMLAGDLEGTQRRISVFFDLFLTARGWTDLDDACGVPKGGIQCP